MKLYTSLDASRSFAVRDDRELQPGDSVVRRLMAARAPAGPPRLHQVFRVEDIGRRRDLHIHALVRAALQGVEIDNTGMSGARAEIVDAVLNRTKPAIKDDVKAFLEVVPSAQIAGEQDAVMSDLMNYAGWVNNSLGFAWPKHISWKTTSEPDWRGQNHHVWPQWMGGIDVDTLSVIARFHQQGLHTTDYEPAVGRNLKAKHTWVDRTNGKRTTEEYGKLSRLRQEKFVDDAARELNAMYERFQDDFVRRGDFAAPAAAIINSVDPEELVGGKAP